ncbi:unnamed protein product, partial [Allacma fusca]
MGELPSAEKLLGTLSWGKKRFYSNYTLLCSSCCCSRSIVIKCLTVFSASNYYEEGSNKGAYVKLIGGPSEPLEPYFVQFNAASPKLRNMTIRQRVGLVEASALKELRSKIQEKQEQILLCFKELDNDSP